MKKKYNQTIFPCVCIFLFFYFSACKKVIQIPSPINTITTTETFADSTNADAAIQGIYSSLNNTHGNPAIADGAITIACGLSSDEIRNYLANLNLTQLYTNTVLPNNSYLYSSIWHSAYTNIYNTNSCIQGLKSSSGISINTKNELTAEAKFIRAYLYFYLTNLYGNVPYLTLPDFSQNASAARTAKSQILTQIISDLQFCQSNLLADYSVSAGARIRANKWAATALLARVYLYNNDYANAYNQSNAVISSGTLFNLTPNLNDVFLINSPEAILQLNLNSVTNGNGNAIAEGLSFIPYRKDSYPFYYLSTQLLSSFEKGDLRRINWVDSTIYSGTTYFYPYKYKIGYSNISYGGAEVEANTILRLAEQYLIRAEVQVRGNVGNGISGAINDLNVIRNRAGLPNYSGASDPNSVLTAIMHERQIELFAESGHRWLDLKRTNKVDSVMSIVTPMKVGGMKWQSYQQLYPIPLQDLQTDPKLTQNPGY